jgi:mannitol/fructose-specific phosphotransferase system IIA component (Ntr-type)
LADLVDLSRIQPDLKATTKEAALEEMLDLLIAGGRIADSREVFNALMEREVVGTAIGRGVAFPHAEVEGVDETSMVVGISRAGIDFDAIDHETVRLFFLFVFPKGDSATRLRLIAQVMKMVRRSEVRECILSSTTAREVRDCLLGYS